MKQISPRPGALTAALFAAMLILTACGSGASATGSSETPQPGGTFTWLGTYSPAQLDPVRQSTVNWSNGADYMAALYDYLFLQDPDTGEVVPNLAESISSEDGVSWTMTLRPNVYFTDGTVLDANAVKFNYQRGADTSLGSTQHGTLGKILSMEVVDPQTLTMVLSAPNGKFDLELAMVAPFIASPQAIQKAGTGSYGRPGSDIVGAGPFKLEEWIQDSQLSFVRNDEYWNEALPYVDRYINRINADATTNWNSFASGEGDGVFSRTDDFGQRAVDEMGGTLVEEPVNSVQWALLNHARAPFDDVRVRRAINLAIDPNQLNAMRFAGEGTIAESWVSPEHQFYDEAASRLLAYDPEQAQALINEVAAESGAPVAFRILASESVIRRAEELQALLAGYDNLEVTIDQRPASENYPAALSGDYEIAYFSKSLGPDFEQVASTDFLTGGNRAVQNINNPALDAAIVAGRDARSYEDRKAAYNKVQEIMIGDANLLFMPVLPRAQSFGLSPRVGGAEYTPMGVLPHKVWVN